VNGDFFTTGKKAFVAPNPQAADESIVYVALEGPEVGTYMRGTARLENGRSEIDLPAHFAAITNDEGLTVQLTPMGQWLQLYVAEQSAQRLVIEEANGKIGRFHYFVQGVRTGYEGHQVIERIESAD